MNQLKLSFTLPLILLVVLVALFWYRLGGDPRKLPSALLNKPVPQFQAQSLMGDALNDKLFHNHVSILTLWASWCSGCRAEHPFLMDIALSKSVSVYGISYKDSREGALNWLSQYGNPYDTCIFDPQGRLAMQFGVYGTPETFLIDQHGVVRYKHIGVLTRSVWSEEFLPRIKRLTA